MLFDFEGNFDALTELYNRAAYEKHLIKLEGKKNFSIIMLDINDFKFINDNYGHSYGDTVLKEVARIIRCSFDEGASFYRIGGDEFCVITKNIKQSSVSEQLAVMHNKLIEKRRQTDHFPTVAFGYASSGENSKYGVTITLRIADQKMYSHKEQQKKDL